MKLCERCQQQELEQAIRDRDCRRINELLREIDMPKFRRDSQQKITPLLRSGDGYLD